MGSRVEPDSSVKFLTKLVKFTRLSAPPSSNPRSAKSPDLAEHESIKSIKFERRLHYIHLNPTHTGIVEKVSFYRYSSASNYVNSESLIEVEIVDNPIIDV